MTKDTLDGLTEFVFLADPPEAVDLCIVLGAPTPSAIYPAIELFHAKRVERILITGFGPASQIGNLDHTPEYEKMARIAFAANVPHHALILEKKATNTLENFIFAEQMIAQTIGWEDIRSVALCGKPLHMRRALMTAKTCLPEGLQYILLPPHAAGDLQADTWHRTDMGRKRVLNELAAISKYALRGDIDV